MKSDTITAIATPWGEGGLGIVRMSGPNAIKIARKIFITRKEKPLKKIESHRIIPGFIIDSSSGHKIDEALLSVMKAPRSYTREDTAEISAHGSMVSLKKILSLTIKQGARLANPGEFTLRAFLNGRIDLIQAESVLEIIRSRSEEGLYAAMRGLEGDISKKIKGIRGNLVGVLASIEAAIDLLEDDTGFSRKEAAKKMEGALREINRALEGFERGERLKRGRLIAISGKPNVGKSSLFNLLLEEERAIVTPLPGTTRDSIEDETYIGGAHLRIVDTAGVRAGGSRAEREGIKRALSSIKKASLVLFVADLSRRFTKEDEMILESLRGKDALLILNKKDLKKRLETSRVRRFFKKENIFEVSVKLKSGTSRIKEGISRLMHEKAISQNGGPVLLRERHRDVLLRSKEALERSMESLRRGLGEEFVALDLRKAIECLDEATGESFSEDLLQKIFSDFCVGK